MESETLMLLVSIGLWNKDGELRRIDLHPGLNVITGSSQTGKSALIEIIRYCLGSTELRVPAGPIAELVAYYGLLFRVGDTPAFVGRPALSDGQQSTTAAQLEIGIDDFPAPGALQPNTNTEAVRDWIGQAAGIEENRFDPPEGATRPPLVAKLTHALVHCFQRQDEIASRQLLFHNQADPFVAQAIRDTLPYFLGVTGPEQLRLAAILRNLKKQLAAVQRERRVIEESFASGLDDAHALLSQAADAGLIEPSERPASLPGAVALLATVRDAPVPQAPRQPPGEEFDRLQTERRELGLQLRGLREQRALAASMEADGNDAEDEGLEQIVRLQTIGIVGADPPVTVCPICESPLDNAVPAVDQIRASLQHLDAQLSAVERDRPALLKTQEVLSLDEEAVRTRLEGNSDALERLAASSEAVAEHQQRLDLGSWVRGRIDHYLETAQTATEPALAAQRKSEQQLLERIEELQEQLDPQLIRDAATSVLIGIGRRMTDMAQVLGLEHAETAVRVDLGKLTVIADTPTGPVYMNSNIGSAKNWVGYHLATVLSLQGHFIAQQRPVPSFLVLDQPTQAFFPAGKSDGEITDQDRADALAQFQLMRDVVDETRQRLQVLVLDHADFSEQEWFRDSVVETWRDGAALIPQSWQPNDHISNDAPAN
jgi:hypothetical protein